MIVYFKSNGGIHCIKQKWGAVASVGDFNDILLPSEQRGGLFFTI